MGAKYLKSGRSASESIFSQRRSKHMWRLFEIVSPFYSYSECSSHFTVCADSCSSCSSASIGHQSIFIENGRANQQYEVAGNKTERNVPRCARSVGKRVHRYAVYASKYRVNNETPIKAPLNASKVNEIMHIVDIHTECHAVTCGMVKVRSASRESNECGSHTQSLIR